MISQNIYYLRSCPILTPNENSSRKHAPHKKYYKRGQDNQRAINNQLNRHPHLLSNQISFVQRNQSDPETNNKAPLSFSRNTTQRNRPDPCRRCGVQFTPEHLQFCQAKKVQCNLRKKIGHSSKVCHSAKLV